MKFFLPILNLVLAGALFFMFTDKMMVNAALDENVVNESTGKVDATLSTGGIRALLARKAQLNQSITTAKAVSARVTELGSVYNAFNSEEIDRLNELLPDHIDNIQLIIDVNGIAKNYGMSLKDVKVETSEDDSKNSGTKTTLKADDTRLGVMLLSFSVTGTYDAYKKFLADLASSLRLIDLSTTSFATDDKGVYTYNVSLKTYWLK